MKFQNYISESSLSRLWDHVQKHSSGAISGYRGSNSKTQNQQNNKEIMAYLIMQGYTVIKVSGNFIENFGSPDQREVGEPSFFVINTIVKGDDKGKLARDLFRLGEKYDQDSVLIVPIGGEGAYTIGTTRRENTKPQYNEKMFVGNGKFGKAAGAYLSRIKGREFAFESMCPETINGMRGLSVLAKVISETL